MMIKCRMNVVGNFFPLGICSFIKIRGRNNTLQKNTHYPCGIHATNRNITVQNTKLRHEQTHRKSVSRNPVPHETHVTNFPCEKHVTNLPHDIHLTTL